MSKYHPLPWRVAYFQRFIEWDARSLPRVVDASGNIVVTPPQHASHPGDYDEQAEATCHEIVAAVNRESFKIEFVAKARKQEFSPGEIVAIWTDGLAISTIDDPDSAYVLEDGTTYRVTLTIERVDVDGVCGVPPTPEN